MPNPSPTPLSPNRPYPALPGPTRPYSALLGPTRPYSAPLGPNPPGGSFRFWGRRHWRQPLNKHFFAHCPDVPRPARARHPACRSHHLRALTFTTSLSNPGDDVERLKVLQIQTVAEQRRLSICPIVGENAPTWFQWLGVRP